MPPDAFIAEKIFAGLILLYILFLLRFRWRIVTSRRYIRQYWRMQRRGQAVGDWLYRVGRLRLALYGLGLVLAVLAAYGAYDRLDPDRRFERLVDGCQRLVEEEKYDQAFIDMTNALRIRPDYVRGHYFIAALHRRQGDATKAEAALWRVVGLDPGFESALAMLTGMLEGRRDAEGLRRLAQRIREKAPVQSAVLEAEGLVMAGQTAEARGVLADALGKHAADAGLHRLMGDVLAGEGSLEEAEAAYRRAVDADFGRWKAHFGLARLYLRQDRVEEALGELNFTRSLQPDFPLPALMSARILFNRGQFDQAERVLSDLLARRPDADEARFSLGRIDLARERYQDAVNSFERLSEPFRRGKEAYPVVAAAYLAAGHAAEAYGLLKAVEQEGGLEVEGRRLLARAALGTGRGAEAGTLLAQLEKEGEASAEDRTLLARLSEGRAVPRPAADRVRTAHDDLERLLAGRDYREVIRGAQEALGKQARKAPFYNLLGAAYLATGRIDEAKAHFRQAYLEDRSNPAPLLNWVNAAVRQGSLAEAATLLEAHNRRQPGHARTRVHLGRIYLAAGKNARAEAVLREAIAIESSSSVAYQQLGVALRLQGKTGAAEAAYADAVRLNPSDAISLNDLANLLADRGDRLDEAVGLARQAVATVENAASLDTLGRIQLLRGEPRSALGSLSRALEMNPHIPELAFHLAQAYHALGRFEEAGRYARLALSMPGPVKDARAVKRLVEQSVGAKP